MTSKQERISNHQKIKLTKINIVRRLNLSEQDIDETLMRRFCASMGKTLPGMIEIEVKPAPDDDQTYQWHTIIYEQPNLPEEANA